VLSKADNDLITNTDPGTPMGELFRRFWLPVALSDELPVPEGDPIRLRIMAEDLVAFRDSDGRLGLLDAHCAHRGAPLFFGRNEECGLRCLYHGWKYDVEGRCLDIPNAPEGEVFKEKVRLKAYPCHEAGGIVWAYLGPPAKQPPFPAFEWNNLPASHRYVARFRVECNYLQSMEGDYDPTHFAFLHSSLAEHKSETSRPDTDGMNLNNASSGRFTLDPAAWGVLEDSDSGVLCIASSQQADGSYFAGVGALWMMPVFCTGAIGGTNLYSANIRVPIDNQSLMFFRLRWSYEPLPEHEVAAYKEGGRYYPELLPHTLSPRDNLRNDYNIDRAAQRQTSFSGLPSFPVQDIAMTENQWGPIADRTREHLTSADQQIIHIRGRLLRAANLLADGIEPSEPQHPDAYAYHYDTAVAPTREKAIAEAKAKATRSRLTPTHDVPSPWQGEG
jgi:phenylpropionate dioxygenase-like ring-hydroxylating dioxygenase large terminal subunit